MDAQLKRGFLEACVLALLRRGDSYGYQLVKDISPHIEISESTLYPILRRLEAQSLLTVYSVEHNGRLRKYYRITDAGARRVEESKREWEAVMRLYTFIVEEGNHGKG